tara:strand:- start:2046 stop:2309 length:264 start_codon:yes stop_codon:yes gene_type:complete
MEIYDKIIAHFGSSSGLARALDLDPQAIYNWRFKIPQGRAYELQVITGGAFTADAILAEQTELNIKRKIKKQKQDKKQSKKRGKKSG